MKWQFLIEYNRIAQNKQEDNEMYFQFGSQFLFNKINGGIEMKKKIIIFDRYGNPLVES